VTDGRWHLARSRLRIAVQDAWGREMLVVRSGGLPGCRWSSRRGLTSPTLRRI